MTTCDSQSLIALARQYDCCVSKGMRNALLIYLLCEVVKKKESPVIRFRYEPESSTIKWVDVSGAHTGNLATFYATADEPTVTSLTFDDDVIGVTNIYNLGTLPSLTSVVATEQSLVSIDVAGCTNLVTLIVAINYLTTLDVTGLVSLQDINCSNTPTLTSITGLTTCSSLITIDCNQCGLVSLNLSGLLNLTTVNCSSNASLTALTLTGCTALTTLNASDCTNLTTLTGDSTCTALTTIDLTNCAVGSLTLGGAANMDSISLTFCQITSLIANSLQTISADILMDGTLLNTVSLPNLTSVGNQLAITTTPIGPTLSFPSLISVGSPTLDMIDNTSLVTLNAPNLVTSSNGISGNGCSALTTLNLNSYVPTVGTNIGFANCALSQASVDLMLARCVASAGWGFIAESIDLSGGTSSAPSSILPGSDYDTLVVRGANVSVNP